MRRRHRGKVEVALTAATPDVIAITLQEIVSLVEVLDHAHAQISHLSDAESDTVADASGAALVPSLFARVGLAAIQGFHDIPLLADEVGLLEAAVINLESYEGNEVVLVAGYGLLDLFAKRRKNVHPLREVHGILAFSEEAGDAVSGSATPSMT
ncbi:hypothetical protein ACIPSE_32440 [Streptomyces sp. NPDC090106]|uniref:hypothetical protein n=1 Tax=Streptomyces sp. NPDC090106 TaxID=3365946 RepID=UPI00381AF951